MDFKYKIADVAKEFGVPAKKVKTLTPEEQHRMITLNAEHYLTYSSWYTE